MPGLIDIVQQISPLKTLPPAPAKVGETSGAATDPASSSPPVGPRSRLPDSRAEHLVPYLNELSKLVSKKNLEDFDGCTLGELVGAMQYSAFHLSCMTTYYKAKVGRYDRKMKEDIQSAMTRADGAEKKAGELNEELTKVKEDLQRQKAMYEAQLESLRDSHRAQVENLEKEADNQYDQGLRHSYHCIMAVLGKQHPDLKIDDLATGVAQHMDEEAAKEDAEGVEPIVIEEENSHTRSFLLTLARRAPLLTLARRAPPRTQLVIPLLHLRRSSQPMLLGLLICHLLDIFLKILQCLGFCSPSRGRADPGTLGFWSRHKQALRLDEPLHALEIFRCLGILLAFAWSSRSWHAWLLSRHKQALRLDEPLPALENIPMLGDSARCRVASRSWHAWLLSRHKIGFETWRAFACLRKFITVSSE
ncbi:hypothetical protein CUMW_084710 [Citrus unshiu]|nr:hypothetical protein CUMW_084710 [Citrus unshiu]